MISRPRIEGGSIPVVDGIPHLGREEHNDPQSFQELLHPATRS